MAELDVIVAGYNVREFIKPCLESILSLKEGLDFKCYYVDDGSSDGSADFVARHFPQVEVIRSEKNLGWGAACNIGIRKGRSEYILLLNSDVTVNDSALSAPVEFFKKRPEVGAVGGRIFMPDGRLQKECMCRAFPTLASELIAITMLDRLFKFSRFFGRYKMLYLDYDAETEVDQPSGTYLAIRRKAAEEVGLFDECYRFYYDDADLSYRMKKKGWKQMFIPYGSVVHHGTKHGGRTVSAMGADVIARRISNKLYFFRKNYGLFRYCLLRPIVLTEAFIKALASLSACFFHLDAAGGSMSATYFRAYAKAMKIAMTSLADCYPARAKD